MPPTRYSTLSDGELLELTVEDPDAFGAFYDRFEEELLGFFMRATQRADLAADLTAEVFASALSSARLFRSELGSARGWLFGIARHELADTWQRGRVEDRARRRLGLEPTTLSDEALERIDELSRSRRRADAAREPARGPARRRQGTCAPRAELRRARPQPVLFSERRAPARQPRPAQPQTGVGAGPMTYLPELRSALLDAAHRQPAPA